MSRMLGRVVTEKLDVKTTILLSFGFFGSSLVWSIYNAYVPILLAGFIDSSFWIGMVMSIDNFFGVVFQPLFGKLSDNTRTRFGRRLPYLFVCMPICAFLFIFVPYMPTLWSMMGLVILFTFTMSIWRTPAVSLMPDIVPGKFQSQANGIVNLMGGIAAIIAFAGGGLMYGLGGITLPFLVGAIMLLGAMAVVFFFVREPKLPDEFEVTKTESEFDKIRNIRKSNIKLEKKEKKSLILLLCAIFFWFAGYNAVETFFSLYATTTMGITAGEASMMLSVFALFFVGFAIPAGIIGAKFGRRNTILVGLVGMTALFTPLMFQSSPLLVGGLLMGAGMFWSCVNINSLPMIVRISGPMKVGVFIGYYYLFSFSSQLVTTPIYGFIHDLVGNYYSLFVYAAITFVLAFICLLFVKHGEENSESTNSSDDTDKAGDDTNDTESKESTVSAT